MEYTTKGVKSRMYVEKFDDEKQIVQIVFHHDMNRLVNLTYDQWKELKQYIKYVYKE